jgi:hypothetical protein
MKIVLLSLLLTVTAHAQTAKVISISDEDAQHAASLHKLLHDTENNIKVFDAEIKAKYLRNPDDKTNHTPPPTICMSNQCITSDPSWASQYGFKEGWGMGQFEYSDDYKYIVPAHEEKSTGTPSPMWGCNTVAPAVDYYRPMAPDKFIGGDHYFEGGSIVAPNIKFNPDGTVQSK